MSGRTKTPPTETDCIFTVKGPRASVAQALLALRALGFVETEVRAVGPLGAPSHVGDRSRSAHAMDEGITADLLPVWFEETEDATAAPRPWRVVFPPLAEAERPGRMLRAARAKEGVSQAQVAQLTGIPQRHLSEMEHGKRTIGKERAKKLAAALQVHFSVFL